MEAFPMAPEEEHLVLNIRLGLCVESIDMLFELLPLSEILDVAG